MFQVREGEIEERIEEVKDLLRIWMRFYRILSSGFDMENLTPERETEFHQIKTLVAQRHLHFMEVIGEDEDKFIGQNILNLVKRVISLKEFAKLSTLEINKISIEWHDANILLNEILGSLEFQLDQAKKGIKSGPTPGQKKEAARGKEVAPVTGNKYFKFFLIVASLIAMGVAIYIFREQIQASPFYQKYLASYVQLVTDIFGSDA